MLYTVTGDMVESIDFSPETVTKEVLQNIAMILSTPKYTVPLYRSFGLSTEIIDRPIQVAESLLIGEIYDTIDKYEPRAEVTSVSFEEKHLEGKLVPKVEVNIIGE